MTIFSKVRKKLSDFVGGNSRLLHFYMWSSLRGKLFLLYSNFVFQICRVDVRFYKSDQAGARFQARSLGGDYVQYFSHEMQSVVAYSGGLTERAKRIASDYMLEKIDFVDGDRIIDCGANVGDLSLYFRVKSIDVKITAFEPSRQEYECACLNLNGHEVINTGLWKEDTTITFYQNSQEADSSLLEPIFYDSKVEIPVKAGEEYVVERIKLLKLEAEGAEPEILIGFGNSLERIEYISADLGFERGKEAESTIIPVANYLLARDFEIVDIYFERLVVLFKNKAFSKEVDRCVDSPVTRF